LVVILAWGAPRMVPPGEWADLKKPPPPPSWYSVLELAEQLNESFFDLAQLPRNRTTLRIVSVWVSIKNRAENRARKLWEPYPTSKGHPVG
jgi:hypothetical protein